jgi:zinc protease
VRVFPYPAHAQTLDNGLRVIVIPMSSGGLVAYWTLVRTGSRDEYEPNRTGFAHFFEHMMFQGTEAFPAGEYNRIVTALGADANAFTSDDLTAYHLGIAAGDLETVMRIESDRFRNLAYAKHDFETEAGAVYGEYRKNRTNPLFTIYEAVQQTAFTRHTYGHTTMGFEADIKAMPGMYDYSRSFFDRYYRPENSVLLIVGDLDVEATFALARKHYAAWKRGYVPPEVPAEPQQNEERRVEVRYEGQSLPILWLAYKAPRFDPGDRAFAALEVLAELAFGETSEIHRKLVLDEQTVELLSANLGHHRDPGLFDIYSRVKDPGKVDAVLAEIDAAIARYREAPPDPARLADLKSRLRYRFLMRLETPDEVASALARVVALTGGVEAVDRLHEAYDAVRPEDVQAAAREFLEPERRTVAKLFGSASRTQPVAPAATPVTLAVPDDPTVTFKVWFAVGSQDDPPGKEGLAALTGAMLAEGSTRNHRYETILEKLYPLASSYSVRVDREMTVLTGRTHRDNVDAFYSLFADAWLRPAFIEGEFERLRTDAVNHLRTSLRYASDEELAKAALHAFVFEGGRWAHPPEGTVRALEAITPADVRAFWREHYTPARAVVAIGGGYQPAHRDRLVASLSELPAGGGAAAAAPPPAVAPIAGRDVLLVAKPGADASISFGMPIDVHRGERDFYALWIANSWLGEHRSSSGRLFRLIREERGLNYGNYSYIEHFPEGGRRQFPPPHVGRRQQLFEVWIRTLPNAHAPFALRAALRELERLVADGMSQEQFELTRSFLSKYVLHYAPTTAERLGYAVDDRFYGIEGEGHLARFREMMASLTVDDVNQALARHLHPARLKIAIVTGAADELGRVLLEGTPSPIEYPTGKPEAVLAEDPIIARHPLGVRSVRVVPVEQAFESEPLPEAPPP